jgi:hypothetical protein
VNTKSPASPLNLKGTDMPDKTRIQSLVRRDKVAVLGRGSLPACDMKANCPNHARLDVRTNTGRWGFSCARCWPQVAARPGVLGLGIAQYLVLDKEDDSDLPTWVS